jgi:hypothetical protein
MEFSLNCPCGNWVTVTEAAADGTVQCPCGRTMSVPPLKEMRLRAGLPAYNISPERMIEHLLASGELPGTRTCAQCGLDTEEMIQVMTECERGWTHRTGGTPWLALILTRLFWPITVWIRESVEEREYGQDKMYPLPLPVCEKCQSNLRGPAAIKQCLHKIPEYSRLLNKYPDARVTIQ